MRSKQVLYLLLKIHLLWWGFFPTLCEPPLAVCVEIVVETGDMKHVSCFDRGLWLAW